MSRWVDELAALLFTQHRKRPAWQVMLLATANGFDVYLPKGKAKPSLVGSLFPDGAHKFTRKSDERRVLRRKLDNDRVVLRLGRDEVIEKSLSIPEGAKDVIDPIVRNQIELLSPWPATKALYDWDLTSQKAGSGTSVKVIVAGKSAVEQRLAVVGKHGLAPGVVDFGDDAASVSEINLLQRRSARPVRGRGIIQILLLLLTVGSLSIGAVGLKRGLEQNESLVWIDERKIAAERHAMAARKTTGAAKQLEARYRLASDEKYRRQPVIAILEALTRALPDGTWLQRLEVRGGDIRLVGQSRDAASLIGLLESSEFFESARFAAPVTPAGGGENFVIEVKATENLDLAALLKSRARVSSRGKRSIPVVPRGSEQ